jgi:hypothetical protein
MDTGADKLGSLALSPLLLKARAPMGVIRPAKNLNTSFIAACCVKLPFGRMPPLRYSATGFHGAVTAKIGAASTATSLLDYLWSADRVVADRQRRDFPLSLSISFEWDSFGGRLGGPAGLGCRRPLIGEPGEARVQNGSDDGANDRGCQVQPGIVEIAGRDHRA